MTSVSSSTSTPTSQISGLISGMDTQTIITELMSIEAQPQTNLKNEVSTAQTQVGAYQGIASQLTSLGTIADSLRTASAWSLTKATSSDSSVTASTTSGASQGALAFDVTSVAAPQVQITGASYAGTSASVAAGALSITSAKGTTSITPADGSLSSVISAINDSSAATGVRATAVQVSSGTYRLQLSSTAPGAANAFTVTGLNDSLSTVQSASDAVLTFGAGTSGAYTVTSPTNTITGLSPGLTLTVTKPTTGVQVGIVPDQGTLATTVGNLVTAANSVLSSISSATAWNSSSKTGGPLMGDSTVRSLQQAILSAVSLGVGSGSVANAGVSVQKDGTLSFDQTAFTNALTADPASVQALFASSGTWAGASTTGGGVTYLSAGARTPEGAHAVTITQAASRSTATLSGAITAGQVITLGEGTQTATYTTTGTETADQLAANLTAAAAAANISVGVSNAGGTLQVTSSGFGSASAFTLSATGGLTASGVTQGLDVAGTIDGVAATGRGQILTADISGPNNGLALQVTMSDADLAAGPASGTMTYRQGLAQRLSTIVSQENDTTNGAITLAVKGQQSSITDMQSRITDWDTILTNKQAALEQQYANLEVVLGNLKSQSSWLSSQIASLSTSSSA